MMYLLGLAILDWNRQLEDYFEIFFTFAVANLHDDAILLVIYPNNLVVSYDHQNWAFTFDFDLI